jgi:hypothetical protein
MHRLMFSADLHVGSNLRSFAQLSYLDQNGRDGGPIATDVDRFDVQQAFVDVSVPLSNDGQATARVGRQEMTYGTSRFVSYREGQNSRRSFDGLRGDVPIHQFRSRRLPRPTSLNSTRRI